MVADETINVFNIFLFETCFLVVPDEAPIHDSENVYSGVGSLNHISDMRSVSEYLGHIITPVFFISGGNRRV